MTKKINFLPKGDVNITGTFAQNKTLTATNTLADTDGLGTFRYQWFANSIVINGATKKNLSS